jgi:hypothetical protein
MLIYNYLKIKSLISEDRRRLKSHSNEICSPYLDSDLNKPINSHFEESEECEFCMDIRGSQGIIALLNVILYLYEKKRVLIHHQYLSRHLRIK